ncbi:MAG TPA: Ku protein [Kofleriaceae bacterium]|nr:Ku protein [Kofleriaceae bacterium]
MAPHALDSATISFGLVAIPIKVYTTSETADEVHFHMIHAGCGERLKQQYVCPVHGEVSRDEIGKGYEVTKGHNLELSKDELKALAAASSNEVLLTEFVPASAVDPIYVDRSYYLGTDKGGERGYRLLREAMIRTEVVGIASYAARGKQYVVMVRPYEDGLIMHQLRYPDEIKAWSEVPVKAVGKVDPAEVELAERIISQITKTTFDPTPYKDEVKDRIRAMLRDKLKGKELVAEAPAEHKMVDLMEALKASLAGGKAAGKAGGKAAKHGSTRAAGHGHARTAAKPKAHTARHAARSTAHTAHRAARKRSPRAAA